MFATVAAHAAARPDSLALSGDGQRWTYAQLRGDAERTAQGLIGAGARPGANYAIVSDNNPASCLAWLAGARCGAIPSNINSLLLARELAWIFGNLQPSLAIADATHFEVVKAALAEVGLNIPLFLNQLTPGEGGLKSIGDLARGEPYAGALPQPEDVFEIAYTSGTTSHPKGVVLTHSAVLHRADQQRAHFELDERDAALAATPLFHQSGSRDTVLLMWRCGGHASIAQKFSASNYWKQAAEAGATYACMVETMILLLERQEPTEAERNHRIRCIMSGGAADLQTRAEERFGFRFVAAYGMTECGAPVAVRTSLTPAERRGYQDWAPRAIFAGWPMAGAEARIVDEAGQDVAEGGQGEIWMRSSGLLREYLRNPEATRAALVDGWLRTGDYGLRGPDNSLYFVDRQKDMMRRGGENIASKEVEGVLLAHPKVLNAVVFPVPDPLWMQEVKAILVLKPGARTEVREFWAWCDEKLARYKVPRYIEFRDTLPTGGSGRVQKQVLRAEPIRGLGNTYDRTEQE